MTLMSAYHEKQVIINYLLFIFIIIIYVFYYLFLFIYYLYIAYTLLCIYLFCIYNIFIYNNIIIIKIILQYNLSSLESGNWNKDLFIFSFFLHNPKYFSSLVCLKYAYLKKKNPRKKTQKTKLNLRNNRVMTLKISFSVKKVATVSNCEVMTRTVWLLYYQKKKGNEITLPAYPNTSLLLQQPE